MTFKCCKFEFAENFVRYFAKVGGNNCYTNEDIASESIASDIVVTQ